MKKLTEEQRKLLERLAVRDVDWVTVNRNTNKRLLAAGLVEITEQQVDVQDDPYWTSSYRITPAGRAALTKGEA